ncbi:AlwI family type II restriction endonuclease [Campylobacter sp. FMV-PI01]|uniref:AlwI family type II restriction endonuclease n=1 Tax=Campylobacter portucalensis TaxID=2608384 RepID=A0A6L5WG13_9BACT|nr:AlwI family type II restriction endonuclease [Campylobacter portucalensis]MSN95849.1 AlwI family type II restriction endonuclease [Campylobacter portucalensis]
MSKKFQKKILSFTTTMRNPLRIPEFLQILKPFENQILNSENIIKIVKNVINSKLYYPHNFMKEFKEFDKIYKSEGKFSKEQLDFIIKNSIQKHKEAGFEAGWESRFDTWYKFIMELGFCYYQKNQKLEISKPGHMLINSIQENKIDEDIVSNIFLNAFSKYQVGNPFKKNANLTTPFVLLLKVLEKLHKFNKKSTGIHRSEISILLCYPNNNVNELFQFIINLRNEILKISKVNFGYSDEFIYEKCLNLLDSNNEKRFKISQITSEAVDEYIRKMRITGLISLRGNGGFLDFNYNEKEKIDYILSREIPQNKDFLDDSDKQKYKFYKHMSKIDEFLLSKKSINFDDNMKTKTLEKFANLYEKNFIEKELLITCRKNKNSKDIVLKLIDKPLRFEFLISIFLKQNFKDTEILPNYVCDDEGIPIHFASGGKADIIAHDEKTKSFVEVSLMTGRIQVANEMIPIERHLLENIKNSKNNKDKFSIFVAPNIHNDAYKYAEFSYFKNKTIISCYSINEFINKSNSSNEILNLKITFNEIG